MSTDLSWLSPDGSNKSVEVLLDGERKTVPLSSEMDFIGHLKDIHGSLKTWPKKSVDARWSAFLQMRDTLNSESAEILKIMVAEKGQELGAREHAEFLKALNHWKIEDFKWDEKYQAQPMGITAIFIDERHPWVSWLMWVVSSLLHGNAVVIRFLPENIRTANYFRERWSAWGFPKGLISFFVGQNGEFEIFVSAHPAVASVLVECAEWEKASYKRVLSPTWKKYALLTETRPVVLLMQESTPELAREIVERSLRPGFGFERLGRFFTLDKYYDGWLKDLQSAIERTHLDFRWERSLRVQKWESQKQELLREKAVRESGEHALVGFDFSNCSPFQQQVIHGPFLSLTRAKYVHEALKFAQTTPLRSHIVFWGPQEKKVAWTQGLNFQRVWWNEWPTWSLESALRAPWGNEAYFVGASDPEGVFYSIQQINSLCDSD
jgi:acyl-CoA reductase-like NAD-dependent aldehyde dehydrogenase